MIRPFRAWLNRVVRTARKAVFFRVAAPVAAPPPDFFYDTILFRARRAEGMARPAVRGMLLLMPAWAHTGATPPPPAPGIAGIYRRIIRLW